MDTILSPRRRSLLLGLGAAALAGCGRQAVHTADRGYAFFGGTTMGSAYTVRLAATVSDEPLLREAVQHALDAVDARMSMFRPDSELSLLNRAGGGEAVPVSAELYEVLAAAAEVSALSGGAFDITVAPAVERWGFGTRAARRVPAAGDVAADRRHIGWRGLALDGERGAVTKSSGGLLADLGGIAKGYGVDRAVASLEALGVRDYMVEVGGEVRTRGVNASGVPWRIGIEQPDATPQRARWVVSLSGRSMATSGDYRNFFVEGGRRYCHEIDPASAAPIGHTLCSVTVVAADCMRADALATALMVLGADRGRALGERHGIAAQFIEREAGGAFVDSMTSAFATLQAARA
jgi:thiamine biosynthesis lipoprotein